MEPPGGWERRRLFSQGCCTGSSPASTRDAPSPPCLPSTRRSPAVSLSCRLSLAADEFAALIGLLYGGQNLLLRLLVRLAVGDDAQLSLKLRALGRQLDVIVHHQRVRPPMSKTTRGSSVPALERWYYALRARQLDGLKPAPRSDKGRAQELNTEQRQLLCDIRRESPSASASLILRTLVASGR